MTAENKKVKPRGQLGGGRGAWKPGQTGNPGGRPSVPHHIRDLARQYTPEAIATLADIMTDPKCTDSSRVRAAEALLNRAWGSPPQAVEVSGADGGPIEILQGAKTDLASVLASLAARRAAGEVDRRTD